MYENSSINPLTARPNIHFSQANEDSILERIFARILPVDNSISDNSFLEYGPGDGLENNSLNLIAKGWKGGWIGNENLAFNIPNKSRLNYLQGWVNLSNIIELSEKAIPRKSWSDVDLVSLDFDGNDYHFTEKLLNEGLLPKVWVQEYNAKFPPLTSWVMPYNSEHVRTEADDYWGASFLAFCELFKRFNYMPVACSAQGANVFFVRNEYSILFTDIPKNVTELYVPSLPIIPTVGYKTSPKTVESFLTATK